MADGKAPKAAPHRWKPIRLGTEADLFRALTELRGMRWLLRGQPKRYGRLFPTIDRRPWRGLPRAEQLALERKSIDLFRSTARFFADPGEEAALSNDVGALMVLRHYGVPTRLLDWTLSPWVAAYFAAEDHDAEDGEIWAFDEPLYAQEGGKQWARWPETTIGGRFAPQLTAFLLGEPPDWFVCQFYSSGFHRQIAQQGAYTMTARFGRDHAEMISELLDNSDRHRLFIVAAKLKPKLREVLRKDHGIWRGSLFPDSAGAAITAGKVFS